MKLLSGARETFPGLADLHRLLFRRQLFSNVRAKIESWQPSLAEVLDQWVDAIVRHVLQRREEKLVAAILTSEVL